MEDKTNKEIWELAGSSSSLEGIVEGIRNGVFYNKGIYEKKAEDSGKKEIWSLYKPSKVEGEPDVMLENCRILKKGKRYRFEFRRSV